jgi:Tol biopolymer transport system component/predicted Ser/Thr protein kinase
MSLSIGDKLGPYEILTPLGKGGMGEVYRARDTRLNRDVAVKVSADRFSERFEREARAIAALNHPNICHLYDVGPNYLVMELVEGPTLAERIKQGAIPLEEALALARQTADALEAAHEKGIVHRDLKPANIKIKADGGVKVLDFGLAKVTEPPAETGAANSPTLTIGMTEAGMILGTAAYMSPEQARGKMVDKRADIWAFGVVLYEMLTGRRLFTGEDAGEILAAVIKEEPQWEKVPAQVRRLLRRCLEKDPQKRLRHIGDVMALVDDPPAAQPLAAPVTPARVGRRWVLVSALACVLAAAVAAFAIWLLKPPVSKPVTRFVMSLPPGQQLAMARTAIAISPDGTRLAYAAGQGAVSQLYLRAMDGLEARAIPGTEGARYPFFSPDGQWLGFSAGGKLKKVSLSGGTSASLGDVAGGGVGGASWGSQGIIAFVPQATGPIQQVSDAGGNSQPLTHLDKGEIAHRNPEFLPGGAGLLFNIPLAGGGFAAPKVAVQSPKTGERRDLLQAGTQPRYAPSGHIVYSQGANLMAAPFDLRRLAVTGGAVSVIEGIQSSQYSFSSTGSLVYVPGSAQAQLKLVWVDRKGTEQPVPAPAHNYRFPRISPDGQRVAAEIQEADSQIWDFDFARGTLTRLTFEGAGNVDPVWTPDGKRIVFKGAGNRLFWQPADGSGSMEALTSGPLSTNDIPGSWSPDGQALVFTEGDAAGRSIWILPLKDRKPQLFDRSQGGENAPRFSPDGRWIAYASTESGRDEIYVRPYPGPGGKWQISAEGGTEPVWNPKGRELFYRNGNKMMAVEVTTQPAFSPGRPRLLFEGSYVPTPLTLPDYDVSPDGQRFLMLKAPEQAQAPAQINVVLNWFEELKRRVPSGKN